MIETFADRLAAAETDRDDRLAVPTWARGEPAIPEHAVHAGPGYEPEAGL